MRLARALTAPARKWRAAAEGSRISFLPALHPAEVWQELVAKGKIRRVPGEETYSLVPQIQKS